MLAEIKKSASLTGSGNLVELHMRENKGSRTVPGPPKSVRVLF